MTCLANASGIGSNKANKNATDSVEKNRYLGREGKGR